MSKHTVTIIQSALNCEREYTFELVSTARNFAWTCAAEARATGDNGTSLLVSLSDGSVYCWTHRNGWEDLSALAAL